MTYAQGLSTKLMMEVEDKIKDEFVESRLQKHGNKFQNNLVSILLLFPTPSPSP